MKFSHWWLGLPGLLYDWGKSRGEKKARSNNTTTSTTTKEDDSEDSKVKNVYNYNYLDDSTTGNTLFSSKEKKRRTLFGSE